MSDATLEAFIMILEVSFILIYDVESLVITYDNFQSMIIICNMFIVQAPGACTIKPYGFVIYEKRLKLVFFLWSVTNTLVLTNTLAYYGIRRLRIHNVFIVQAPTLHFLHNLRITPIS